MDFSSFFNFDNLFGDFFGNNKQAFNTKFQGYTIEREPGKGIVLICVTLGIPKENVFVKLEDQKGIPYKIVSVIGETPEGAKYFDSKVNYQIPIKTTEKIIDISYTVKDGITKVYLKTKHDNEEQINPKLLDNGDDDLNW